MWLTSNKISFGCARFGSCKSGNKESIERGNWRHLQGGAKLPPRRPTHPTAPDTSFQPPQQTRCLFI